MKPPAQRLEEAKKRDEERAKRSPQDQIALLDKRFGKGLGAQRERARLLKKAQELQQKKAKTNG